MIIRLSPTGGNFFLIEFYYKGLMTTFQINGFYGFQCRYSHGTMTTTSAVFSISSSPRMSALPILIYKQLHLSQENMSVTTALSLSSCANGHYRVGQSSLISSKRSELSGLPAEWTSHSTKNIFFWHY